MNGWLVRVVGASLAAAPVAVQATGQHADTATRTAVPDSPLAGATVTLRVDGLSCPFCAYGLEKRLKAVAAIDTTVIRLTEGLVYIRPKPDSMLTDEALREAVKRAGFTLREIRRAGP